MATIQDLLDHYGESHQNGINKAIHWLCVPAIMFSLIGLLYSVPFFVEKTVFLNWGAVFLAATMVYYFRLSLTMFAGFVVIAVGLLWGNHHLAETLNENNIALWQASFLIFAISWIGQFIGHKIEGKKPSFLEDLQFLLVGPAWLLHFIYKKIGLSY
ncbi:MAG: hypothetical protein RI894_1849 [Bacteroidota bacterium]